MRASPGLVPAASTDLARRGPPLLAVVAGDRLVPTAAPDAATADAYRRIAAHLLLEAERRSLRLVGVVSAHRGEGKTTAAINLAVCLGRSAVGEQRVLLVDGDARHRTLTRLLGGSLAHPRESLPDAGALLVATSFHALDLLVAPPVQDPLALQAPAACARALRDLAARYSHVVVDCPPLLDDPDAVVLRECVDSLVVVIRAARSRRRDVERAFAGSRRPVVGVLLNGVEAD